MKKFLLILAMAPAFGMAQGKLKNKETKTTEIAKIAEGYSINGNVTGYPDGTVVDLLNGNNRMPEATTKISNGQFTLTGKLEAPDFKLLTFDKSQAFAVVFLDNSIVSATIVKDQLDRAVFTGSKSHDDYLEYSRVAQPFEPLFQQEKIENKEMADRAVGALSNFLTNKSSSFISPLAIFRIHQLTSDDALMERQFAVLAPNVQSSPIGAYVGQQIMEARKNPMGKVIPDFEQADVNGKMVSIKSFRGKYVLIDFWASWCGPCRGENPNVVAAFNKYKEKNFTVLGISLDKTKDPWLAAIQKDGLTWTQVSDLKGWSNEVAQQFGIQSIPQNFLIDPNGIVIGKNLRGAELEAKLESILK